MRQPEEVRQDLVRQWVSKADGDMRAAEILLSQDYEINYAICFHSQQAAEKYLKAFLTYRQIDFPKTHILGELLDLVSSANKKLADSLREITELNPYGVEVRYPGDLPEPTAQEARRAFELAGLTREAVLSSI